MNKWTYHSMRTLYKTSNKTKHLQFKIHVAGAMYNVVVKIQHINTHNPWLFKCNNISNFYFYPIVV